VIRNYYYTVCSLPQLLFEPSSSPLSWSEFLRLCGIEVPARRMEVLHSLGLLPSEQLRGRHPVLDSWVSWEGGLRNALSRIRARRSELPEDEFSRAAYPMNFPTEEAEAVMNASTPLEAEMHLERVRWDRLDALDLAEDFSLGRLIVYGLKLRLLERRGRFDRKTGESVLGEATDISPGSAATGVGGRSS